MLCLTLLAVPALAAEATIDLDYVTIVGEGFAADTFCGVDALYNETGATLFCNELIERFYSAVYGVTVFTNSGDITAASPSGYWFEVTYTPQPGDIAYASAEARERYGNHYAIVKSVDEAGSTVTLFEQNWVWDGKAGVNRRIPYDGGCYTFYTMCSSAGRAAPAGEAEPVAAAPAAEEPQPVSDDVSTIYAWGSGISSITGTPSSWAARSLSRTRTSTASPCWPTAATSPPLHARPLPASRRTPRERSDWSRGVIRSGRRCAAARRNAAERRRQL